MRSRIAGGTTAEHVMCVSMRVVLTAQVGDRRAVGVAVLWEVIIRRGRTF